MLTRQSIWCVRLLVLFGVAWFGENAVAQSNDNYPAAHREDFEIEGHRAFIIRPPGEKKIERPFRWVWYAPALGKRLPGSAEKWLFERFHRSGIAIAGVDVGESYGSPRGRATYQALYEELTANRGFNEKPVLLARSRGGLMLYNWAVEHPRCVGGIVGIYPVCNLTSYPGLARASKAYEMTAAQLESKLIEHNPIDRLDSLAQSKVPIYHIHGDKDETVPLESNSLELAKRYAALGGPVKLEVIPNQGHNMWKGWFESEELAEFAIAWAWGRERPMRQDSGQPNH